MEELLNSCELCPRRCKVNRNNNELGYCRASNKMKIGGYHLHMWEEPIITGKSVLIIGLICAITAIIIVAVSLSYKKKKN